MTSRRGLLRLGEKHPGEEQRSTAKMRQRLQLEDAHCASISGQIGMWPLKLVVAHGHACCPLRICSAIVRIFVCWRCVPSFAHLLHTCRMAE